jgi:hypothetical protein
MNDGDGYQYDVFLSYPSGSAAGTWVHNHFLPVLREELKGAGPEPDGLLLDRERDWRPLGRAAQAGAPPVPADGRRVVGDFPPHEIHPLLNSLKSIDARGQKPVWTARQLAEMFKQLDR